MNAKVVFIVELNAQKKMFFYCLLQIKPNLSYHFQFIYVTKI